MELLQKLNVAREKIIFIGVTPFNINWGRFANQLAGQMKSNKELKVTFLCESDNMLFSKSFTSDTESAERRMSFRDLKFMRDQVIRDLPEYLLEYGLSLDEINRVEIEILHLSIPIAILVIDECTYLNPWLHEISDNIIELSEAPHWKKFIDSYVNAYIDRTKGRKYAADPKAEILELFDHNRIPRGIYPRDSFYDTDFSQLVVWALVFDRNGKLLIHKRSANAKDNKNMWDKSVGGHVDFSLDVDTSRAIAREVTEELFSDEMKKEDIKLWGITAEDMLYLGEWRPKKRKRFPFNEISRYEREWVYFRLLDSQHLFSPRYLPEGGKRRLRVIADVYLFISSRSLTEDSIKSLKNSKFMLIELSDLKTAMDLADKGKTSTLFIEDSSTDKPPDFTPDLTNIMTGELRDILAEFSNYIKQYIPK